MVPPYALSDGEKVTVYMGATTSGPFDLPEDCKLRSAVVWLDAYPKEVVFKKAITVTMPYSAIFSSPQHYDFIRLVHCADCNSYIYKFRDTNLNLVIDEEHGKFSLLKLGMVAIVARYPSSDARYLSSGARYRSSGMFGGIFYNKYGDLKNPSARFLAKLFWPRGELPNSFRVYIYYIYCLPTEVYKVTL